MMPFTGLFNTPPRGGSLRGNDDNGPQGVQGGGGRDILSGARKRSRDVSFGQMSNYGGLETSSSVGDRIAMMVRQQQIEIGRLIEENARKLRMELAGRQVQQAKQLVAAVREENLEKLKFKDDEIWGTRKCNYFLQKKVKSLIDENQSLTNSVMTHEATIASLQAQLLEVLDSERRLLEANVAAVQEAESCCDSNNNNINVEVDHANAVSINGEGYGVGNGNSVMNQDGYVGGDNMDQCDFSDYIIDGVALANIKNII